MEQDPVNLRSETDLYGYSKWLAKHLGVVNKTPRWNFQHMWIWWDLEDRDIQWALDPNCFQSLGMLVQDEQIADVIRKRKFPVQAAGLPFLSFNENHPIQVERNGKTLYVPTHSTAWRDVSDHTSRAVKAFCKDNDVTVLLSIKDQKVAPLLKCPWLKGACSLDGNSFYRIQKIFHEFEYMISDRMGSHILYGLACGMKVGISAPHNIDTVFSEAAIKNGLESRAREIRTTKFLADRFPGLVIEGGQPSYTTMPKIDVLPPEEIAKVLWS